MSTPGIDTAIDVRTATRRTGWGFDVRVLGVEVAEGLRAILREPTALFFSVLFPVGMFALFASLFGNRPGPAGIPYAATMLATYARTASSR